ncbi:MAG: hypothetical protein M3Z97_10865 [Candidatus Dormibacteraeota bacterium]|nr:hypothetical protein [Candidatus Dormibacteraeota bacterium]
MSEGGLERERERSGDAAERLEEDRDDEVDRDSEQSFPASDPPSAQPGEA